MKIVITDVSVLFDLFKLDVLPYFFKLEWNIFITDFVYNEIAFVEQVEEFKYYADQGLLKVITISADEAEEISVMQLSRKNRSFPDKSMLWKAQQLKSILLTCDGALRKEAERIKIEVHGTIWIIENLIINNIITRRKGIDYLVELKKINTRAPIKEIDRALGKLK